MQLIRSFDQDNAALVGFGIRVMLLSKQSEEMLEHSQEMYEALEAVIEDPAGYGLFVLDCDDFGGIEAGRKAVTMMGELAQRLPVILISKECQEQSFPQGRGAATMLRAPLSSVSLRVGFEHALRDRLSVRLI